MEGTVEMSYASVEEVMKLHYFVGLSAGNSKKL